MHAQEAPSQGILQMNPHPHPQLRHFCNQTSNFCNPRRASGTEGIHLCTLTSGLCPDL